MNTKLEILSSLRMMPVYFRLRLRARFQRQMLFEALLMIWYLKAKCGLKYINSAWCRVAETDSKKVMTTDIAPGILTIKPRQEDN